MHKEVRKSIITGICIGGKQTAAWIIRYEMRWFPMYGNGFSHLKNC